MIFQYKFQATQNNVLQIIFTQQMEQWQGFFDHQTVKLFNYETSYVHSVIF